MKKIIKSLIPIATIALTMFSSTSAISCSESNGSISISIDTESIKLAKNDEFIQPINIVCKDKAGSITKDNPEIIFEKKFGNNNLNISAKGGSLIVSPDNEAGKYTYDIYAKLSEKNIKSNVIHFNIEIVDKILEFKNLKDLKFPELQTCPENVQPMVDKVKNFANNGIPTIYIASNNSMPSTLNFLLSNAEATQQNYLKSKGTTISDFDDIISIFSRGDWDYLKGTRENANFYQNAILDGRKDIGYKNRDKYLNESGVVDPIKAVKEGDTFVLSSYNCFPDANPNESDVNIQWEGNEYIPKKIQDKLLSTYSQAMNVSEDDVRFDFVIADPFFSQAFLDDCVGMWDDEQFKSKTNDVSTLSFILRHANSISTISDGSYSYANNLASQIYAAYNNPYSDVEIEESWNKLLNKDKTITPGETVEMLTNQDFPWNRNGAIFLAKNKPSDNKPYINKFSFINGYEKNQYTSFNKADFGKPFHSYGDESTNMSLYVPMDFSSYSNYFGWDNFNIYKDYIKRSLSFHSALNERNDIFFVDKFFVNGLESYDINKRNLLLPLDRAIMQYDLPQNIEVEKNYGLMVNKWLKEYPLNQFNYIVKAHPGLSQDETTKWCKHFFGDNWNKICITKNKTNLEFLFALDIFKNESFDKDETLSYKGYQLINPLSYTSDGNQAQTQYAGIANFSSTIYTSLSFLLKSHFNWEQDTTYVQKLYTDRTIFLPFNYSIIGAQIPEQYKTDEEKKEYLKIQNKKLYSNDIQYKIIDHESSFFGRERYKEFMTWLTNNYDELWNNWYKVMLVQTFSSDLKLFDFTNNQYWNVEWLN